MEHRALMTFFVTIMAFLVTHGSAYTCACFQRIFTPRLKRAIGAFEFVLFLFSTVGSQMSPQIACNRGCIVALVAFV